MTFVVIYDACVLYPAALRDLLIRLAAAGTVRARWSDTILDEAFQNIRRNRPDLDPERLERTRVRMIRAVPDCLVTGYEGLVPGLKLPDESDRHVLAAAIRAGAQVIVTFNLKHFPEGVLAEYNMEAKHPDDFVVETIDLAPAAVIRIVTEQAAALKCPPISISQLLDTLREQRLAQSVARLREMFGAASG
ncbi:MAG TPA: PIN domain-containing protein [Gemmatimonadales bacterium]